MEKCPYTLTGADFYALSSDAMLNAVKRKIQELELGLNFLFWAHCSILTTLLVIELLKFQMLTSDLRQYFLLKKCEKLFSFIQQKISVYFIIKAYNT